jgi:hypothetical protein
MATKTLKDLPTETLFRFVGEEQVYKVVDLDYGNGACKVQQQMPANWRFAPVSTVKSGELVEVA